MSDHRRPVAGSSYRTRCPGAARRLRARLAWARVSWALVAAPAAVLPAAASFAQERAIEEVVVTGTYIRRQSQFDSPSPLVTLSSATTLRPPARTTSAR